MSKYSASWLPDNIPGFSYQSFKDLWAANSKNPTNFVGIGKVAKQETPLTLMAVCAWLCGIDTEGEPMGIGPAPVLFDGVRSDLNNPARKWPARAQFCEGLTEAFDGGIDDHRRWVNAKLSDAAAGVIAASMNEAFRTNLEAKRQNDLERQVAQMQSQINDTGWLKRQLEKMKSAVSGKDEKATAN